MKKGYCKLCRSEKFLCKAHIIPDFLYKVLYDEKHNVYRIEPEVFKKTGKVKKAPTGEYDITILCQECDNDIIGLYESYAKKFLFNELNDIVLSQHVDQNGNRLMKIENIEYKEFKLFLLSLIYKMSISFRPIYKKFKLGDHEYKIREMLLTGNPEEETIYPVIIASYAEEGRPVPDFISPPRIIDNDGYTYVKFHVCGLILNYVLVEEANKITDAQHFMTIKTNKEMYSLLVDYQTGFRSLMEFVGF